MHGKDPLIDHFQGWRENIKSGAEFLSWCTEKMKAWAHAAQILTLWYLPPIPPSRDEVAKLRELCSQGLLPATDYSREIQRVLGYSADVVQGASGIKAQHLSPSDLQ